MGERKIPNRHDANCRKTPIIAGDITPTPAELAWMRRAARVLSACPATLMLHTVGDASLMVSRGGLVRDAEHDMDRLITEARAGIGIIRCSVAIHSCAG
jgi:hypothetical protein